MKTLSQSIKEIEKSGVFLGGPVDSFEEAGRKMLMILLNEQLMPYSKVLDIGCGCLRGGYWIIRFLEEGSYFGIEPNKEMLNGGLKNLFTQEFLTRKKPLFDHNTDFDASVFNIKFDYFLARSIWTHASKHQIQQMLKGFQENAEPTAKFLTSFVNAENEEDFWGDEWVGKSHESEVPGIVKHSINWIQEECKSRALTAQIVTNKTFDLDNNQRWIRITKN